MSIGSQCDDYLRINRNVLTELHETGFGSKVKLYSLNGFHFPAVCLKLVEQT